MKKRILAVLLSVVMILPLVACGSDIQKDGTENLQNTELETEMISSDGDKPIEDEYNEDTANAAAMDFAVRLFQEELKNVAGSATDVPGAGAQNKLISPISVLLALAMTTNGANGETLAQMETVLGMSTEQLNVFAKEYLGGLSEELRIANSIWLRDSSSFTVNDSFTDINKTYYGADVFKKPFDQSTVNEINGWVDEKTDGMIKEVVREIPEVSMMYLINALSFVADWEEPYLESQLKQEIFTTAWGTTQEIDMMHSMEDIYLEDEKATGVMKYYEGKKYAFVALLPKQGVSLSEYTQYLTGEGLQTLLSNPQDCRVETWIPEFELDYEVEMKEVLKNMGMTLAFDENEADFSALGSSEDGNIFINSVLHKTFIEVSLEGTKAGAVTIVDMYVKSANMDTRPLKQVKLDHPFIYMIIDCENNQPVFMGTMNSVLTPIID